MEFETQIIFNKTPEDVQKTLDNRIRMGWQIHSISEISKNMRFSSKGSTSYAGTTSTGGSISVTTCSIAVTYMKLSEADRRIGENIQTIADKLSKN